MFLTQHPWKYTEKALHEAFGENYGERLRISRNDVIGSGCAAQVYKASLDGQDVRICTLIQIYIVNKCSEA